MLLTGSRASFEIEGERPPRIRLEVMGRVEFHFFPSKMTSENRLLSKYRYIWEEIRGVAGEPAG